jgi:REP element-mobilizing transposase RayT
MAGTYSKIYIHIVFAVKKRESLIQSTWENQLYQYITGIVQNKGQKMLSINGMPDHIHILIGFKPTCSLSDLVREIKKSSTNFINENKFCSHNFYWQEGYGALSHSHYQLDIAVKYVINQKAHHKTKSFKNEYIEFLNENEIDFQPEYLFEWLEN